MITGIIKRKIKKAIKGLWEEFVQDSTIKIKGRMDPVDPSRGSVEITWEKTLS